MIGNNKRSVLDSLRNTPPETFPKHVLIIPDGNGRWAKRFSKLPFYGHRKGFEILKKVLRELLNLPVKVVTIWGFSSDNWKRSQEEVSALMDLYERGINETLEELKEKNVRFVHIGRRDRLPESLVRTIEKAEKETRENTYKIFCIAIDFSGQDQEIRIMEEVLRLPRNTKINIELIEKLRDGKGIISPADLIIRTSGEQRTSDLGWLSQNSEFYSIERLLPEAKTQDFLEAIVDYTKRDRRFGGRKNGNKRI